MLQAESRCAEVEASFTAYPLGERVLVIAELLQEVLDEVQEHGSPGSSLV